MNRKAHSLLSAVILVASAATAAGAQELGMDALVNAPDQDSLLPPEVVPLDPRSTAGTAPAHQSYSQAVPSQNYNDAPGLAQSSAQDMRRQAFESLYGNAQAQQPPAFPMNNGGQQQWRAQAPADPSLMMQQQPYTPPAMPQGQYPMAMGNAPQGATMPAQSQTLTGGPKSQPVQRDIRRKGFSNVMSAASAFGAGALGSAVMMRPSNPWLGAGFYGLTMTGLGNRNSFRF